MASGAPATPPTTPPVVCTTPPHSLTLESLSLVIYGFVSKIAQAVSDPDSSVSWKRPPDPPLQTCQKREVLDMPGLGIHRDLDNNSHISIAEDETNDSVLSLSH